MFPLVLLGFAAFLLIRARDTKVAGALGQLIGDQEGPKGPTNEALAKSPVDTAVGAGSAISSVTARIIHPPIGGAVHPAFFGATYSVTLEATNHGDADRTVQIDLGILEKSATVGDTALAGLSLGLIEPDSEDLVELPSSVRFDLDVPARTTIDQEVVLELAHGHHWGPVQVSLEVFVDGVLTHGTLFTAG